MDYYHLYIFCLSLYDYYLYKPLYENPDMATGLPVYIIVKDNKPRYVRGVAGREIQKYRVQQKNMLKSNNKD